MAATGDRKKRPAASQAGPKPKKAHVENTNASEKGRSKKRSRPVTLPVQEDSGNSSDDDFGEDNVDEVSELPKQVQDELEEADARPQAKDPNASRESHKAQRALLDQRKAAKPHSALLTEAKRMWTLARQKSVSKEERKKHINSLMDIIRGKVKEIVFKHDASRIVQTVVKYGGQRERDEIATELKGRYKDLAQNKYSKFLVTKLIRMCPNHRAAILSEFQGQVLRLLLHRDATSVLADAFELYANAYERSMLLRDFYGKEAMLFTVTIGSDADKEKAKKGMAGLLEDVDGERRRRVMTAVKENLVTICNNSDKGAVSHAIVHRIFWEYLMAINALEDQSEQEKLRREMFESCQDILAEMVHTKDGSRVVREFIAQGTAKDRKLIIKALKPHVERMCKDDEAQLVLFTALDVIDDTKLTAKSLVSEVTASASALYDSPQGRRSLIYLVSPRTRRHFTPAQIALLAETDTARARTSKKDDTTRAEEIRKAASEPLLAWVASKGPDVARDPGGSLVVCEIMLYADGDKTAATETMLTVLTAPYPSPDPTMPHPISLPPTSRLYKTLLQGGPFSHVSNAVVPSPFFSAIDFASKFVEIVGRDHSLAMAQGDGAFVVAVLCERAAQSGQDGDSLRSTLKEWFSGDARRKLEEIDKEGRGRAMLLKQVAALG